MKILEFGSTDKRKLLLIHGFQSPWQVWDKYIEHCKNDFHITVPVITGHDPDKKEDFISFEEDARNIEDSIISRYGNKVFAVFAMSMGGVLAATIWQDKSLSIEHIIFDGSPLTSMNPVIKAYMRSFYLSVTHKTQQHDEKTIKQASGTIIASDNMDDFLKVLDNMTDNTIINAINAIADFKLNTDISTAGTKIHFFHGTAPNEMLAKKSAKFLKKHYPDTEVKCFVGKAHCENSLIHPEIMIDELDRILLGNL